MILQDRYRIEKEIGKGKYSVVYQAYDQVLLQHVAIKELTFDEHEKEFMEEAKVMFGKYEIKGFPEVREVFRENGSVYLVMEYLSGKSFREYVRALPQGRMDAETAIRMLIPVMHALEFLHAEGMLHLGISADKLIVRENGECCLTGIGTYWVNATGNNEMTDSEIPGPWDDVLGISTVLYEVICGKPLEKQYFEGRAALRNLSDFVEIDGQIEQTIQQGLNLSIQQRFFCISAFAERLKGKIPELSMGMYKGRLQAVWGEKWLYVTTSQNIDKFVGKRKIGWTKKQRKKFIKAGIILGIAAGIFCAVIGWYQAQPVTHEKLIKKLERIEDRQEYSDSMLYMVTKDFVEENHLVSNKLHKFPVKKEEIKSWAENYFGKKLSDFPNVQWNGNITVFKDFLEMTSIGCYETTKYQMEYEGNTINIEWKYDVIDEYVTGVIFDGNKEVAQKLLKELVPFLVQETYLTEEEIKGYFEQTEADTGYYRNITHGKYVLTIENQNYAEEDLWKVYLENYLDPGREKEKGEETLIAGNYVRDSKEYNDFIHFVENRAVSVEKTEKGMLYTLDVNAVEEWGQPSNEFLIDITAAELKEMLTQHEGQLELTKQIEDFTVEVYSGGGLKTSFLKGERYATSEDITITIYSDYVSGKISSIGVYSEENEMENVAKTAAKVMEFISEDVEKGKTEELFLYQLEDYKKTSSEPGQEHWTLMASLSDCGYSFFRINDGENICVFFEHHSFSMEDHGYAPYDWA